MIKYIFFDLDGTLIDSLPDITNALNKMRFKYNLDCVEKEKVASIIGQGFPVTVKKVLELDFDKDKISSILEDAIHLTNQYYNNICGKNSELYDNVLNTLESLQEKNIKMAVVTNKEYDLAIKVLKKNNLMHFFDAVIGGNTSKNYKPHSDPLLLAVKKLGASIKNSAMIGDSYNDFICAHNINMKSIIVSYGYANGKDINDFGATKTIDKFEDILTVIESKEFI